MTQDADRKPAVPEKPMHGLSENEHKSSDRMDGSQDYDPDQVPDPVAEQEQVEAERYRNQPDISVSGSSSAEKKVPVGTGTKPDQEPT